MRAGDGRRRRHDHHPRLTTSSGSADRPDAAQVPHRGARSWLRRRRAEPGRPAAAAGRGRRVVHAKGMASYPRWVDDPGTYLSQAWSFQYERALSPYSYFYDHAPAGWIQLGLWSMLTDGFGRHDTAIGFGNECMLIAKVVSAGLLYALGRRLGISRPGAAAVGAAVRAVPAGARLQPVDVPGQPRHAVDGAGVRRWRTRPGAASPPPPARPWRSRGRAVQGDRADPAARVRLGAGAEPGPAQPLASCSPWPCSAAPCVMALYPLYALYKGELLPTQDRNSLVGTAQWQLLQRQGSGSLLDPHSGTSATFAGWLRFDRILLLSGLAAILPAVFVRRLRPIALALAIGWLACSAAATCRSCTC